ncbi:MAG: hypothetical protein M3178_00395 [Pseudomonadota bacterium]|nr:hypothetical protein [Pseudomonadota bacterium]
MEAAELVGEGHILTSLTGVYGEKMGMPIGNTILYFSGGSSKFTSSFAYWTDNLGPTSVPQMVDRRGNIHPAPWVPFTRAGCNVGAFSVANIEFENTTSDIDNVFGSSSPEHNENLANHTLAVADFEGTSTARREAGFAAARHMPLPTSFKTSRAAIMASRRSSATSMWHRHSITAPRSLSSGTSAGRKAHRDRWHYGPDGAAARPISRRSRSSRRRRPPKRIRQSDGWFEQGELSRRVLDALRRAGEPIRAPGVVWAVMVAKALDPADLQSCA